MKILNCPIILLATLFLASMASAELVVWNESGVSKTDPPKNIYSYTYDKGVSVDTIITRSPYVMTGIFEATKSNVTGGAGFGFYWKTDPNTYKEKAISLSEYKGVCLAYSATTPVRLDFKQNDITDNNYFGTLLESTEGAKVKTFVAFSSLAMGWDGSDNEWNIAKQMGLQFSYKDELVEKYGRNSEISIYAVVLGNECETFAPTVKSSFETSYELEEGETLKLKMKDIFEDKDGDKLTITATMSGSKDVVLISDELDSYSLNDEIVLGVNENPKGTLTLTLKATDPTNKTVSTKITIDAIDVEHVPVVKDTTLEMSQGEKLSFAKMYSKLAYDLDGDEYTLFLEENLTDADGEDVEGFTIDLESGKFAFEPDPEFVGTASFKLSACEDKNIVEGACKNKISKSNVATITIKVKYVNHPPEFTQPEGVEEAWLLSYEGDDVESGSISVGTDKNVIEKAFNEDFGSIYVSLDKDYIVWTDPDLNYGDKLTLSAKGNDVVDAELVKEGKIYELKISSKANAYGKGYVYLFVTDEEGLSDTLFMLLNVKAVIDNPVAKADNYEVFQGDTLKVKKENGVLVNDEDFDGDEIVASVVDDPEHGTLVLKENGSFTYIPEVGYEDEDSFTYVASKEASDGKTYKSKTVRVTINVKHKNMPPVIVEGVADTAGNRLSKMVEDKTLPPVAYLKKEIVSWFTDPEGEEITFKYVNKDGKFTVKEGETSASVIMTPNPDSCGTTQLIVIATDASGDSVELVLTGEIQPVNDPPVAKTAIYDVAVSGWEMTIDLDTLVYDIDSDTLFYSIPPSNLRAAELNFEVTFDSIDKSLLTIKVQNGKSIASGSTFSLPIKVSDGKDSARISLQFNAKGSIPPPVVKESIFKSPVKAMYTWKTAIAATRGTVAIMDMQGRVMWTSKLPVTEDEVKSVSNRVQGRKVLKVNSQTWTIK